jgi:hypothetical protein
MRGFAFLAGFALGLVGVVLVAGNVLLYLLTGRLPSVEMGEEGRPIFGLITPQEVVAIVKDQIEKEREEHMPAPPEGGELS